MAHYVMDREELAEAAGFRKLEELEAKAWLNLNRNWMYFIKQPDAVAILGALANLDSSALEERKEDKAPAIGSGDKVLLLLRPKHAAHDSRKYGKAPDRVPYWCFGEWRGSR